MTPVWLGNGTAGDPREGGIVGIGAVAADATKSGSPRPPAGVYQQAGGRGACGRAPARLHRTITAPGWTAPAARAARMRQGAPLDLRTLHSETAAMPPDAAHPHPPAPRARRFTHIRDHRGAWVVPVPASRLGRDGMSVAAPTLGAPAVLAAVLTGAMTIGVALGAVALVQYVLWPIGQRAWAFGAFPRFGTPVIVVIAVVLAGRFVRLPRLEAVAGGRRFIDQALRQGLCASCGHGIGGLPAQTDGCIVCPECAAAWRSDRIRSPIASGGSGPPGP